MLKQIPEMFGEKFLLLMLSIPFASSAFADAPIPAGTAPAGATAQAAPGFSSMLVPFALMFAVVYFLMIRPQQKKMKEQQGMLSQLKHGDEVVTSSGILGTIRGITDKVVTLEVDDGVKIKILKSQVSQVIKGQITDAAS